MKTKKAIEANLVFGVFRPGTIVAKMAKLLADGKPRTVKEIAKIIKPKSVKNIGLGRYRVLQVAGKETKQFRMQKTDGKIQLVKIGKSRKAA